MIVINKRVFVFLTALVILTLSVGIICASADGTHSTEVIVNGEMLKSDVPPFIEDGRTLVPARAISEYFKYNVNWYDEEKKVEIKSDSDTLILYIGSCEYYQNGEKKTMDVPAKIKDGRTVVPLRLVAEAFGCEVEWIAEDNVVNIARYNVVEAETPYDILANVADYTKIILKEREYNLSELDEVNILNPFIHKEDTFDGYEYVIEDVSDLIIEAPVGVRASVVTERAYANVLSFNGCSNITLKNIVAGHKVEKGYCVGGVVRLGNCIGVNIKKCGLYGCGTYGIVAEGSSEIFVEGTDIYECTYGLLSLTDSSIIEFDGCMFRDSEEFAMFEFSGCDDVYIKNSFIKNNKSSDWWPFISIYKCTGIEFVNCEFKNNSYTEFCDSPNVKFDGCKLQ